MLLHFYVYIFCNRFWPLHFHNEQKAHMRARARVDGRLRGTWKARNIDVERKKKNQKTKYVVAVAAAENRKPNENFIFLDLSFFMIVHFCYCCCYCYWAVDAAATVAVVVSVFFFFLLLLVQRRATEQSFCVWHWRIWCQQERGVLSLSLNRSKRRQTMNWFEAHWIWHFCQMICWRWRYYDSWCNLAIWKDQEGERESERDTQQTHTKIMARTFEHWTTTRRICWYISVAEMQTDKMCCVKRKIQIFFSSVQLFFFLFERVAWQHQNILLSINIWLKLDSVSNFFLSLMESRFLSYKTVYAECSELEREKSFIMIK